MKYYTLPILQGILHANGLTVQPKSPLPIDQTGQYELYYYTCQPLTLSMILEDSLQYFCEKGLTDLKDRRVCFLLDTTLPQKYYTALIVTFSHAQAEQVERLRVYLQADGSNTSVETPVLQQLIKHLYQNLSFTLLYPKTLGLAAFQPALNGLQQFFSGQTWRLQPIADTDSDIVFTEGVLQLLYQGKMPAVIDAQHIYQQHLTQCRQKWLQQLQFYQQSAVKDYAKLYELTTILNKYALLALSRKQYAFKSHAWEELEYWQAFDHLKKQTIYARTLNFPSEFGYLTLESVAPLLNLTPLEQLNHLNHQQTVHLQALLAWEKQLTQAIQRQKSWWVSITQGIKKIFQWVHDHSIIGVGGHLGQWLSYMLFPRQSSSRFTQALPWLGQGLGLWYSYIQGSYGLSRTVLIGWLGQQLHTRFHQNQLDDQKATYRPPRYSLEAAVFPRAAHVLVATVESLYTGSYRHMVQALGGAVSSLGTTTLAKRFIPDLQIPPNQIITENQWVALFFISWLGYDLGHHVIEQSYLITDKLAMRKALQQALCLWFEQYNITSCLIDFPKQAFTSDFWFKPEDTLRLSWATRQTFYETTCQVVQSTPDNYLLSCEDSHVFNTLPIAKI